MFATQAAQWHRLRAAFRSHHVDKLYRALVVGELQSGRSLGDWSEPMEFELAVARHRPARVGVVDESAPGSRRRYRVRQSLRVVERLCGASLVEVRIVTGFLHQIRVTLAHLGHAVVGDALYGDPDALALGAGRQLLHAARLRFEEVCAESPDPRDFREQLQRLRATGAIVPDRRDAGGRLGESRR